MKKEINLAFDPYFQAEIASLVLKDHVFALKYYTLVHGDKDLRKRNVKVFTNDNLNQIFSIISELRKKEKGDHPSFGATREAVSSSDLTQEVKNKCLSTLDKVFKIKIDNKSIHERKVLELLKTVKTYTFHEKMGVFLASASFEDVLKYAGYAQNFYTELSALSFSQEDVIRLTRMDLIIEEYSSFDTQNIPLGVVEIDQKLNGGGRFGGLAKREVTVILSGVNQGKSFITTTFAAISAMNNRKGILISLEGKKLQGPLRMISCITKIPFKKLVKYREYLHDKIDLEKILKENPNISEELQIKFKQVIEGEKTLESISKELEEFREGSLREYLGDTDYEAVISAQESIGKNIRVYHAIKNPDLSNIERIMREAYEEDPYEWAVIDYGNKMTCASLAGIRRDLILGHCVSRLELVSSELNIATVVPFQVNREGMKKLNSDHDDRGVKYPVYDKFYVAECKSAIDTSATVISWNRLVSEERDGIGRFCIEKQREGEVKFQVGISPDWSRCNIFRGERYYIGFGEEEDGDKPSKALKNVHSMMRDNGLDTSAKGNTATGDLILKYKILTFGHGISEGEFLKSFAGAIKKIQRERESLGKKENMLAEALASGDNNVSGIPIDQFEAVLKDEKRESEERIAQLVEESRAQEFFDKYVKQNFSEFFLELEEVSKLVGSIHSENMKTKKYDNLLSYLGIMRTLNKDGLYKIFLGDDV